jgi:pyridoxal phosphate enzyme (YggS family)
MKSSLADRVAEVEKALAEAAEKAGRSVDSVKLVAVSKTHPAAAISAAVGLGLKIFGENKVQEAETKINELGGGFAEWHLIGHLQSNKARKAVALFDVIHSLDSRELTERLERICDETGRDQLGVLIQLDLGGESTKNGAPVSELAEIVATVRDCRHLKLLGLMTLPPYFDDPEQVRPFFKRLRELRDEFVPGGELSMGMSHDFEVAIAEGATFVRIGTAIFGDRDYK